MFDLTRAARSVSKIALSDIGRVFFGLAMAETGLQTIYYRDFPYWLLPANHSVIPGLSIIAFTFGVMLALCGASIVFKKQTRTTLLILGSMLLLIFLFYFIPYQLMVSPNVKQFGDWENAAKELAFASGTFIIAGTFTVQNESHAIRLLSKLIPLGTFFFAIPIVSFGIDHYLYAKEVADYVPSWMPFRLFWAYFAGTALLASGVGIILKIKARLAAALLGIMIFSWVIMLHIPRIVASPTAYIGSEFTSAFIALAYSGIAFVVAGGAHNKANT